MNEQETTPVDLAQLSKLADFFGWMQTNKRQHFFHFWSVMGDFNKMVYHAQYAHIHVKAEDPIQVLTAIKAAAIAAFPEST